MIDVPTHHFGRRRGRAKLLVYSEKKNICFVFKTQIVPAYSEPPLSIHFECICSTVIVCGRVKSNSSKSNSPSLSDTQATISKILCYSSQWLYSEMVSGRIFKRIDREYKGRSHDSDRIELKVS